MPKVSKTARRKVANSPKLRLKKKIVLGKKYDIENSSDLFIQVLRNTPFHLATVDADGVYVTWNKASESMFGYKREEIVGKLRPVIFHRNKEEADEVIDKALKTGGFHKEVQLVRRNGDEFPALLDVKALYKNGQLTGFLASAIDLTKEKEIESEKKRTEEKHRQLFENSKDGIIYMDKKGIILDANTACSSMSGYNMREFIGKSVFKLPFLEQKQKYKSLLDTFFSKKDIKPFELELNHKNGDKRYVEVNLNFVKEGGYLSCYQVIVRDITSRKLSEYQIRESENYYRTIIENSGAATWIEEVDGTVSFVNHGFEVISGYSKDEIVNKMKWYQFFSDDSIKKMEQYHKQRRINPYSAPRNYESVFVTRDGEERSVFLTVAMIPGTSRNVVSLSDITTKKIVENELRASKKLFDDLVQGSPIAIFVVDTDHKVVYWNKALEKMTGIESAQMIGTSDHWRPFYNTKRPMVTDMMIDGMKVKDILNLKQYKDLELEESGDKNGIIASKLFEDFNGQKKWLRFIIKPLYDIENKLVGAIETVEDITDRKRMSQDLQNRMREFQVLYQVNAHIRMLDPLHKVFNNIVKDLVLCCDVIKPARARIVFDGKTYTNLKRGEKFSSKIEENIKVLGKKRGSVELGYVEKIDNPSSYILRHEKKVVQVVGQTLGKHIQHREILTRYQKLITRSVVGVFILQDGEFKYVNPKFGRILKYREADLIGMKYSSVLPKCQCHSKIQKSDSLTNAHCKTKAKRKDKTVIDVEIYTQTIDYYGRDAILGTVQDITKLEEAKKRQQNFSKELQEKIAEKTKDLQRANKRLQSLNEIKDEFIAVTSHELRSPLTAARGYLSFLMDDNLLPEIPESARDYLVRVYDNVEVLNNLVNNILDVSRIEMDRLELHKTPTDIIELTKNVIKNLSFQSSEKQIKVNFVNKLDGDSLILSLDHVRIRQVLRNILDNAIKYSPEGKDIDVEIEIRGIGLQISIIDQGVGIRKSEIFEIFDKFKQAKNSKTQYNTGGAGLGLFIARKIMELHNGMIWADSKRQKGTAFRVQLPLD